MIKLDKKISFGLFAISLFFLGLNLFNVIEEGFSDGFILFRQISSFAVFIFTSIYFYKYTYKSEDKK